MFIVAVFTWDHRYRCKSGIGREGGREGRRAGEGPRGRGGEQEKGAKGG